MDPEIILASPQTEVSDYGLRGPFSKGRVGNVHLSQGLAMRRGGGRWVGRNFSKSGVGVDQTTGVHRGTCVPSAYLTCHVMHTTVVLSCS